VLVRVTVIALIATLYLTVAGSSAAQAPAAPSTITGPTIILHRCSDFTSDYDQFTSIGPFSGLPAFGIQYCTYVVYPSQPILVSQGAVNVVIPVVFYGDLEMAAGPTPSSYPFGQSLARFSVTVTATDAGGWPLQSGVQFST
jgi:hypothetical protein